MNEKVDDVIRGQESLFGGLDRVDAKPARPEELEVLITVKAAPNPSEKSGETVCVAGVALAEGRTRARWVRLYPVNFRFLEADLKFTKYDIVRVRATPAVGDPRAESWTPNISTLVVTDHLPPWQRRRQLLDSLAVDDMCELNGVNQTGATGPSLGLVPIREIRDLRITAHPGWSASEQAKIDAYVSQLDLFDSADKSPLEAPRFIGHYIWRCHAEGCRGHEQSIIDWEFVALQRRLARRPDAEVREALRSRFLDQMFGGGREPAFFVGNQSKRHHVFHVLGVYYPN